MVKIQRFDICLIQLGPSIGSEIKKTRLCLVISPDSMNLSRLQTIIVAPMTTTIRENFPTRINVEFQNKKGQIALDQLRAIDRTRIVRVVGHIQQTKIRHHILKTLALIFE